MQTGVKSFGCENKIGPAVANPFVEVDRALGGFGGEIGRFVVYAQGHSVFLLLLFLISLSLGLGQIDLVESALELSKIYCGAKT